MERRMFRRYKAKIREPTGESHQCLDILFDIKEIDGP
jgi:hypothetical protein